METLLQRIQKLSGSEYSQVHKAVIAYSGGVDSTATALLLGELGIEVITVSLDLGQGVSQAKRNAPLVSKKNFFFDAKEQLLEYAKKAVWANSMFKGHPNGEGLSRPLIARYLVQAAEKEGAQAVVHGSSGVGNDQFRMDNAIRVLAPQLHIIAPVRDWNLSRGDSVSYLQKKKLKLKIEGKNPFSTDETFWCRTIRYGALSEDDFGAPQEAYSWTRAPSACPAVPVKVSFLFENGFPAKAVIGEGKEKREFSGVPMFEALNKIGGENGIGRQNCIEDKIVGLKAHEVFECPAAVIISFAHKELERLTLTSAELDMKDYIDHSWARLVFRGGWYTRLRHSMEAFISQTQTAVCGTVDLSLCRSSITLISMKSPHALYDSRLSSREGTFNQRDSRTFAKLYGLQDVIAYRMDLE